MFETLEKRQLLSGVVMQYVERASTMLVVGTEGKDHIEVTIEPVVSRFTKLATAGDAVAAADRAETHGGRQAASLMSERISVWDQDVLVARMTLPLGTLKAINVIAGAGDDVLRVTNSGTPATVFAFGDEGADDIQSSSLAGAPGSVVYGGAGDDLIRVFSAEGSTDGHHVWGENGNDTIVGSDGDDALFGDNPDAKQSVEFDGNDLLFGGNGNDTLIGGGGDDLLYGEAGDDYLDGGAGTDMLDGGDDVDTGVFDKPEEKLISIEKLIGGPTGVSLGGEPTATADASALDASA